MTETQQFARSLALDPLGRLVAIATKHSGKGLLLSSRSKLAEATWLLNSGESLYHARRAALEAIALRTGTNHPDYAAAREIVRALEEAEGVALGVAA